MMKHAALVSCITHLLGSFVMVINVTMEVDSFFPYHALSFTATFVFFSHRYG